MAKSYKGEVIADSSGQWCGNSLRFTTSPEAEAYIQDLKSRWTMVRDTRVVPSDEEVNYRWRFDNNKLYPIGTTP